MKSAFGHSGQKCSAASLAIVEAELRAMDRQLAWKVLQLHQKEFQRRWNQPEVADWLDAAGEYLERHLHQWVAADNESDEEPTAHDTPPPPLSEPRLGEFHARIVKTSFQDGCPVVTLNPSGMPPVLRTNTKKIFNTPLISDPRLGNRPIKVSSVSVIVTAARLILKRCGWWPLWIITWPIKPNPIRSNLLAAVLPQQFVIP